MAVANGEFNNQLVALDPSGQAVAGWRVRIALHDVRAVFHRPHPKKETDKGAVKSMRRFLSEAGVTP